MAYDRIVGEAVAERERREAARAEVSRAPGRWDKLQKKLGLMRSSLENFTPDAHIGNEAELGTRAHPFAAYIAEMHRSIHKQWAFDFLPSLMSKGALDPWNDMERYTLIGIVLDDSGTVEKVTIRRPSGFAPFDAAAMDAVVSSSPFPKPPDSIRSPDGKVYLDWTFHRDDRQCGTFGAHARILERIPDKGG
jgi:TonB family protein